MFKALFKRNRKGENGQALILVLVLLTLVSLLIPPLLDLMGTGATTGAVYQEKTDELYAADAGIQDACWVIKWDKLKDNLGVGYDAYDYNNPPSWPPYSLAEQVNNQDVQVSIENSWIPPTDIIPIPDKDDARSIIEAGKLLVVGSIVEANTYEIKIVYYPEPGENLIITSLGVWLPGGFTYGDGDDDTPDSILESDDTKSYYPADVVNDRPHASGTAVIWTFEANTHFIDFPDIDPSEPTKLESRVWFKFTPDFPGRNPNAIAWITTAGVDDIPYTWSAGTHVYRINSVAGDTEIEAYTVKNDIQELGAAIKGDYRAIGNSLMLDTNSDHERDFLLPDSSAEVDDIPDDAYVELAFLYWSGWFETANKDVDPLDPDTCSDFDNWNNGSAWTVYTVGDDCFRANFSGGSAFDRDLTLDNTMSLGTHDSSKVTLSWDQWITGGSGATNWLSPSGNTADTGGDGNGFESNATNAYGDGGGYASNINGEGDRHRYFGYDVSSIPAGSTIEGIEVRLDWWLDNTSSTNRIYVELSWNGGVSWTSSETASSERTNDGNPTDIEGSSSDTWGHNWTISDLSSTNFRVRLRCYSTSSSRDFYLDWVPVRITYKSNITSADGLDYAISYDGGIEWTTGIAFRDIISDDRDDPDSYTYEIPKQYLTDQFLVRFTVVGFDDAGQYCNIDNIRVTALDPDDQVSFQIDGQTVYFDAGGAPTQGIGFLVASPEDCQVLLDESEGGTPTGYFYSCKKDVTELIRSFTDKAPDPGTNHPGNGTYTVGNVEADTHDQKAYAGWSLIIIYSSTETHGHQLYLFDDLINSMDYDNIDFDHDAVPGGNISGFLVPNPFAGEVYAAKMTVFVGEGDEWLPGDSFAVNGETLSDGFDEDNVWNGRSIGMSAEGVDVDNFFIEWDSEIIKPTETSAQIDLESEEDTWSLIYIIIAFRSEITMGGHMGYLIY